MLVISLFSNMEMPQLHIKFLYIPFRFWKGIFFSGNVNFMRMDFDFLILTGLEIFLFYFKWEIEKGGNLGASWLFKHLDTPKIKRYRLFIFGNYASGNWKPTFGGIYIYIFIRRIDKFLGECFYDGMSRTWSIREDRTGISYPTISLFSSLPTSPPLFFPPPSSSRNQWIPKRKINASIDVCE